MTADLDLSPEAVERLASRCSRLSQMRCALQDNALSEASATLRALSAERDHLKQLEHGIRYEAKDYHDEMHRCFAEIARLRAERDAAWKAGAEAMREAAAFEAWERWNDADAECTPDYIADCIAAVEEKR